MKKRLFEILFLAFVVVMIRLLFIRDEQTTAMLTCLSVVLVLAMMRLR